MVRSTFTTTVLSPLSETTTPSRIRLGIYPSRSAGHSGAGAQLGLDPRDVPADLLDTVRLLQLAGGRLEAQVELLALQLQELVGELIGVHAPDVFPLPHAASAVVSWAAPASRRVTTLVRTDSLA